MTDIEEIRHRCFLRRRKPGELDPFHYYTDVSRLLDRLDAFQERVEELEKDNEELQQLLWSAAGDD